MGFPDFYRRIPRLAVVDPLADLLGASDNGRLAYGFEDAVRLTGHACPTVAIAYGLTVKGMQALFPDEAPRRGSVSARFAGSFDEGSTGVVASVVSLLTGAAGDAGFKGLGDRHVRRGRCEFGAGGEGFSLHRDDGGGVALQGRPERIAGDPWLAELLPRCLAGSATQQERADFQRIWQRRIERLLVEHWHDQEVWLVRPL